MNKRLTCKSPTRAPASRSSDESQHEQQLCNQQLISASPHHTLTPGGRRKQQFCSQLTALNDHRWFCKSELLAILCTHNTNFHLQGVNCISFVCGVEAEECSGAGAPFHTTSATDGRHDTTAVVLFVFPQVHLRRSTLLCSLLSFCFSALVYL